MPKPLNLEQLRNQARELLRAFAAKKPDAAARVAKVLPQSPAKPFRLAHAQAVIARENGQSSWPKLKAAIEREQQRRQRRSQRADVVRLQFTQTLEHARSGDVEKLAGIAPVGKAIATEVVATISAVPGALDTVVRAYIAGLRHPNPKVRFECAHCLDRYGHPMAVEPLVVLSYDTVPRVRWMAMHALSCDACKVKRAVAQKAFARASELALNDPSVQVRRHASIALGQLGGAKAASVLEQIVARDSDEMVRRNARSMLRLLAK